MPKLALLAVLALPFTACQSASNDAATDAALSALGAAEGAAEAEWRFSPEHHDGRQLVNRLRGFLADTEVNVQVGRTGEWAVRGNATDVALVQFLAETFDQPGLDPRSRAQIVSFEERDARLALNSARGLPEWSEAWIVAAASTDRWYAMIPDAELDQFNAVAKSADGAG